VKILRYLGSWIVDILLTFVIFLALWIPLALFFSRATTTTASWPPSSSPSAASAFCRGCA
jgi:hypothetical protein